MDAVGRESTKHDNFADWLPMSADWSRGSITNLGPSAHGQCHNHLICRSLDIDMKVQSSIQPTHTHAQKESV